MRLAAFVGSREERRNGYSARIGTVPTASPGRCAPEFYTTTGRCTCAPSRGPELCRTRKPGSDVLVVLLASPHVILVAAATRTAG